MRQAAEVQHNGATMQSWKAANPRELLERVVKENPTADKETLLADVQRELRKPEHKAHIDVIIEYWFFNSIKALDARDATKARVANQSAALKVQQAEADRLVEKFQQHVKREARAILMDFVLPTGVKLRDATGGECASAGGWLSAIADVIGVDQKVGDALTEDQLHDLWDAESS